MNARNASMIIAEGDQFVGQIRGGEYVGVLVIDKVGPDWASGHMDQSKSKSFPQRGDDVATQL